MSKDTVKQAISETIVSNGKRGISAQSLSNVLNLMVDEGGTGGGSGCLMVKVGTVVDTSGNTPTILTGEEKEYNQQVFEICKNAVSNGEACPLVTFDLLKLLAGTEPEAAIMSQQGSQLLMVPMLCGYLSGVAVSEMVGELGYNELIYSVSMVGGGVILLPSGDVIVGGEGLLG
jgi:hypothetical protein